MAQKDKNKERFTEERKLPQKWITNSRGSWSFIAVSLSSIIFIVVTIYCLLSGWFIVFQNLLYIPIIIACRYYAWKGFTFSVVISLIYCFLVVVFTNDPVIILQAAIRCFFFIGVAGTLVFLLRTLKRVEDSLRFEKSALEKSKESFFSIVDKSDDGLIVTDCKGLVYFFNSSAARMFGFEKEKCTGESFVMPVNVCEIKEIKIIRQNGEVGTGEMNSSRIKWSGFDAVLVIVRDITARKKTEEALMEALKVKSDFVGIVSHELRTPLASIKEGVALVLDKITGEINEEQKKYLGIVKDNVDRLNRVITAILDFQAFESGKIEFKMEAVDVNGLVKEAQEAMLPLFKKKGLAFETKLCGDLPRVKLDRDKITQVLTNLVSNSLKFTEKGGVTITTSRGNNFIQVVVKDTGIGIKKEDMKKLFQEFTQLERKVSGTGLGLSICKKIVEAQKGKIWIESTFGKGTDAYLILPVQERRGLIWQKGFLLLMMSRIFWMLRHSD